MNFRVLVFFFLLLNTFDSRAQIDSLNTILTGNPSNEVRFNTMLEVGNYYRYESIDSAFSIASKCVILADQLGNLTMQTSAYKFLGVLYFDIGDDAKAMDAFLKALHFAEQNDDELNEGGITNNIAMVYQNKKDEQGALANYRRALTLVRSVGSQVFEANILLNMGSSFYNMGETDSSIYYYQCADSIYLLIDDESARGTLYNNWGLTYLDNGDFETAIVYFNKSLVVSENFGELLNISMSNNNLGDAYLGIKDYDSAQNCFRKGLHFAKLAGALDLERDALYGLAIVKSQTNAYDSAYFLMVRVHSIIDTLQSQDSQQQFSDLKAGYDRDASDKELVIKTLEAEKANSEKSVFRTLLALTGVFVVVLVLVFVNRYKIKQRANTALAFKNSEIEEKNKSITDSIHYAKLIQQGLLPDSTEIANRFLESFVLFHPKDIVSGDFYWTSETNDFFFLVTADCTGHGVPGGFMSVLGSSLLNEVILENKLTEPCEILDLLRVKIIRSLKQNASIDSGSRDGIDLVLCRYSRDFSQVTFAGAYNPLWVLRDSVITEYATNKQPVGLHIGELVQFTQQKINLRPRDVVYTFTDGFADQFGGPKGKKFKYRQLQELLISNAELPMNEQALALENAFNAWKGELEQIDDVLVIGVRV